MHPTKLPGLLPPASDCRPLPPVVGVTGLKDTGKTTLTCRLVERLAQKGLRVCVLKHDPHDWEWEPQGTDTQKARAAGAAGSALLSQNKFSLCVQTPQPLELGDILPLFSGFDLVLLEGFHASPWPRIELLRYQVPDTEENTRLPRSEPGQLIAVAADWPVQLPPAFDGVPVLDWNDIDGLLAALERVLPPALAR